MLSPIVLVIGIFRLMRVMGLIDSQLAALQPPDPAAEGALWIDVALPPDQIIDRAVAALSDPRPVSTGGETP